MDRQSRLETWGSVYLNGDDTLVSCNQVNAEDKDSTGKLLPYNTDLEYLDENVQVHKFEGALNRYHSL